MKHSPLGQPTIYVEEYAPEQLFPIPRKSARDKIGLKDSLPFSGVDIWTGYEISWLNPKGKPQIAIGEFRFPCTSPNVIESKSFKLYLNSFNQSKFASFADVQKIMQQDLSKACAGEMVVDLFSPKPFVFEDYAGVCLDPLEIETNTYEVDSSFLKTSSTVVEESLYTHLLKSNCLATGQPDWGSLHVRYSGPKIDREALLKYFISFRRHAGFAEHCVEQIYCDLINYCAPERLSVYGRYTRRGGLDINPFRSNFEKEPINCPQVRQ